jgi:pectate lyase
MNAFRPFSRISNTSFVPFCGHSPEKSMMRKEVFTLVTLMSFPLLAACSGDGEGENLGSGGGDVGTGGFTASGGDVAGSGGDGAASGGDTASGGATGTGGEASTGGATGTGGDAGTGGSGATCNQPMGWATRSGRSSTEFNVTGGGSASPIVVNTWSDLEMYAGDGEARVIHIDGDLGGGWQDRSGDRLEIKSNKTIIGLKAKTQIKAAIHISDAKNVILRNIVIQGPGSNSDQAWDNLSIEGDSANVWIDHCEFWDGQDGNADVVKGADNVTFTYNIFGYKTGGEHNFSNLVASSDDEPESEEKLNITLMFNWFTGVAQRQPRCRYGDIHIVNNLFSQDGQTSDYGISAGKDCRVLTEANHFIDIKSPIYTSHKSGSSAHEVIGDNIFENTSGNTEGYGTAFTPPYDYQADLVPSSQVKAIVQAEAGATLVSPASCD